MIPLSIDRFKIPHRPGVYIYQDNQGRVLYVGKAIDLYHRVSSYFQKSHLRSVISRTEILVSKITAVRTIVVESELEALILEANLIKKYLPPFNIRLTDDSDYLYIAVTCEDFPKITSARKQDLAGAKKYWGPFPSGRTVRNTLKSLRRVFPWCANTIPPPGWHGRPCFYYHIGQCPGSCAGLISKSDYHKIIRRFSQFMDGKKGRLISGLAREMRQESDNRHFETAGKIKKTIEGVLYLTQINRTKLYLENPNFLQEENRLALEQLKNDLQLGKLPERIEGYDISNIQGKEATGAMVVLTNGEIDKSRYRKFKIRISGKPDDVGMMKEIIKRRFRHPEWPMPDLIIVDGGRGQARVAKFQITNSKLQIPVFGLAKRMEWLYPPEGEIIKLSKKSLSLKRLQKLRDEAHRFAVNYHRKLHRQSILNMI